MSTVYPILDQDRTIFRGSDMGFTFQPNLADHPQILTVFLNKNEIPVIHTVFLPPNIQHLSLVKNYLRSDGLPVEWPRTLKSINLDHNSIYDTDIVEVWPSALEDLSFDDNPLRECPKGLPETLKSLSMNGCELQILQNLPNSIKKLDCAYNKIKMIQSLPAQLECLFLSNNLLSSKFLSKCKMPLHLKLLNLDYNNIKFLPKNLPDSLEHISARGNQLIDLPGEWPQNLQMLVLNDNRIQNFQPKWKHGQKLIQLHIRNNCVTENLICLQETNKVAHVYQAFNWNQDIHHIHAYRIQKCFHVYQLKKGIRTFARLQKIQNQLMEIAYLPELITRFNQVDSLDHFRIDLKQAASLLNIV
jgi:Leucine-rich repeat (LRR) protein